MNKLLLLIPLFLVSCGPPLGRANPGSQVPWHITGQSQLQDIAATRGVNERVGGLCAPDGIYEALGTPSYVAVHEFAHLSDGMGSYHAAYRAIQPSGTPAPHMLTRLIAISKVMQLADKLGGKQIDLWRAIQQMHGDEAVQHNEILRKL